MTTQTGSATYTRSRAKNYISDQAQKRLDELIPQIQNQGLNALRVDAHPAIYFRRSKGGTTCSCVKIDHVVETSVMDSPDLLCPSNEIKIDFNRPLFGERLEVLTSDDTDVESREWLTSDSPDLSGSVGQDHLFAGAADCAVCFKLGFVPGYLPHTHNRQTLTHYDVTHVDNCVLERGAPHSFVSLSTNSSLTVKTTVPKYWTTCDFQAFDNHKKLDCQILLNGVPITAALLKSVQGSTIELVIKLNDIDQSWTHLVLDYTLDMEQMLVNVSQFSKNMDYTMFDTLGSINVFFPAHYGHCESGDLIYLSSRKILLKVTDVTYSQTAKDKRFEWQCNTRIVQPQEPLWSVVNLKKLR
jgi:hypothetical protein